MIHYYRDSCLHHFGVSLYRRPDSAVRLRRLSRCSGEILFVSIYRQYCAKVFGSKNAWRCFKKLCVNIFSALINFTHSAANRNINCLQHLGELAVVLVELPSVHVIPE